MLPSCREVAEQLSENMDQPVRGLRWVKLKLHFLICGACRRYEDQLELTTKTINLVNSESQPSDQLKQKLMQVYREREQKNDEPGPSDQ